MTPLLAAALLLAAPAQGQRFSFAVLADVQYADKDVAGRRDYRASLEKLKQAGAAIRAARPAFAIQLGDLVDGGAANLDRILPVWNTLGVPGHSVLGNHDFCLPREVLTSRLGMPGAWYSFAQAGWRLVVLDGMDVSLPGRAPGSPERDLALKLLEGLRAGHQPNAQDWNGAISERQRRWLGGVLEKSAAQGERVLVFCHFPILKEASTAQHLLWNADAVLQDLDRFPHVAAWMNGHDHNGGYAQRRGVHFVTFPGMIESGPRNSWTVVEVWDDRLELRGSGTSPSRTLKLR
jgi:3',5'-cyclic AMP phosphodiesterase CpdA